MRLLSALLAMAPFMFGMIRAVQTDGLDLRYIWVAMAAFAGAMVRMVLARQQRRRVTPGALAAGIFLLSTVTAALAARLLGTSANLGMLIVAAAFGFCFAASTYVRMRGVK